MTDLCHLALAYARDGDPDLSFRQMALLGLICDRPGLSVRPLADLLDVSRPVVTRARHALQQLGLVTASPCEFDARKIAIVPTARGAAMRHRLGAMG